MEVSVGKAWVVYSEDTRTGKKKLISLLNPRRTSQSVRKFVEQIYVDKYASIDEKVRYKKRTSSWPYGAKTEHPSGMIRCGHSPIFRAIYCHTIEISESSLYAKFEVVTEYDQFLGPEFYRGQLTVATQFNR